MNGVVMVTAVLGGGSDFASLSPFPPSAPPFPNLPVPMETDSPNICPHLEPAEGGAPSTTSAVALPSEFPPHHKLCVSATPPAQGSPAPLWGPQNTCVSRLSWEAPASTLRGPRGPGSSPYLDIAGPAFQCPWKSQGSKVSAEGSPGPSDLARHRFAVPQSHPPSESQLPSPRSQDF